MSSDRPQRVNALDVLPADLAERVARHVDGVCMWVPRLSTFERRRRDAAILEMRRMGRTGREIADYTGLTERRVYQILAHAGVAGAVAG